jgi:non-ribosomal peptide synthase protein (TIGR01720 family)
MGQVDRAFAASAVWRRARESNGPNQSHRGGRSYVLEVTGWVADGRLQLQWVYSRNLHHPLTVERLAGWYGEALRALIAHCQSPAAGGYTPSDFPLARLDRQELDELVARFSQTEES